MRLQYFPDTDTLSIELKEGPGADVEVISDDVTLDLDANGDVLAIGIEQASQKVDLSCMKTVDLPDIVNSAS